MGRSHAAKRKELHGDGDGVTAWAWRWSSKAVHSQSPEVFLTLSLSLSHSLRCYFDFWKMKMWLLCCLFYELFVNQNSKKNIICGPYGESMSGSVVIAFSLLTFWLNINYIITYCDYWVVYSSTKSLHWVFLLYLFDSLNVVLLSYLRLWMLYCWVFI